jgi:hypothetical protein
VSEVFISYSRRDAKDVRVFARELEAAGHKVWLDTSAIQGGAKWQEEIVRGIERADVFVIALSRQSVESWNVERELGLAYVTSKTILPVMFHRVTPPPRLQYALVGLEVIDVSAEGAEAGCKRVLQAIASPDARAGVVYLDTLWRDWLPGYLWLLTWMAYGVLENWNRQWLALIPALVLVIAWVCRRIFIYVRLRRGIAISTELKGFTKAKGRSHCRIVSEWRNPEKGERYRFYSRKVPSHLLRFVERTIPVIVDPRNFRRYRVDLSFLPREPRGSLVTSGRSEASASPIFVSHSESDDEAALLLARKLEAAGRSVRNVNGTSGKGLLYQEQVFDAITDAGLFLLALSPDSVVSARVRSELDLAVAKAKRIVAVVLRRTIVPRDMEYALVSVQHVDLSQDFEAGVARLLDTMAGETPKETVAPESAAAARAAWLRPKLRAVGQFALFIPLWFVFVVSIAFLLTVELACKVLPARLRPSLLQSRWLGWLRFRYDPAEDRLHDFKGAERLLLTEYRSYTVEGADANVAPAGIRIITQWRDPVSQQLYLFQSRPVACEPHHIRTRIVPVYVDPGNLRRYEVDLSFLPEDQRREVPKRTPLLGRLLNRVRAGVPTGDDAPSAARPSLQNGDSAGARVFISYSDENAYKAGLLIARLENAGYEVVNRSGGTANLSGDEEIQKKIGLAPTFMIVLPSVTASDLGAKTGELRHAYAMNRHIVPVAFDGSEIPPGMQLALAGIHRIDLSHDIDAGVQLLLNSLASRRRVKAAEPERVEGTSPPAPKGSGRRILTGAIVGALAWALGSMLSILCFDRGPAVHTLTRIEGLFGLICGGSVGAIFYKPRRKLGALVLVAFPFAVLTHLVLPASMALFLPAFLPAAAADSSDGNLSFVLAPVLGTATFIGAKLIQDCALNYRLRKKGKLLLTEYKGFRDGIVSQWRDPLTDEVHTFVRKYRGNPSKRIRSNTIAVFVDPANPSDYYMDLSYSANERNRFKA